MYFLCIVSGDQIKSLNVDDGEYSARQAVRIMEALQEAKNFNQIASNLQVIQHLTNYNYFILDYVCRYCNVLIKVVQYLGDVEKNLVQMIQLVSAKDQSLVKVQMLSDFRYDILFL